MLRLAKNNLKTAFLFGMLLGAVSFVFLVITQKNFKSDVDLLIVQNQAGAADYYTLSRSADYLTDIIAEAIYSEKFLDEAWQTGKISSTFISGSNAAKLKKWQKIISIRKNSNVGIINLSIFGDSENQAAEISGAVTNVLINKNALFLGRGQELEVRVLSGPIIKKNPSPAQIAISSLGGFIVGLSLVFIFVIYREEYFKKEKISTESGKFEIVFNKPGEDKERVKESDYLSEDGQYWKEKLEKLSS